MARATLQAAIQFTRSGGRPWRSGPRSLDAAHMRRVPVQCLSALCVFASLPQRAAAKKPLLPAFPVSPWPE